MKLSGYTISNIGMKKIANEDNYLINNLINDNLQTIREDGWEWNENQVCYSAVFDGMGGGECGQWASKIAAEEFRNVLVNAPSTMVGYEIDNLANKCFLNANRRIVEARKKHSVLGTTATLLYIWNGNARLFHLGDSRAYLFRENRLIQLTKDQTLANLKIEAGIYKADDPEAEKDKNLLTEYLGADETLSSIRPLISSQIALKPEDKILLCSDGLYHFCSDEEIKNVLQRDKKPDELADCLVCKALKKGGIDNITCLVITVRNV